MDRYVRWTASALPVMFAALLTAGCASTTPVERQQATVQSLVELRDTMTATQRQIEQTLAALLNLTQVPPGQVGEAYRRYASAANTMAAQAGRIEAETARLRERREAWLAQWTESYGEVRDRQLRSLSEERREQVLQRFENIEGALVEARDELLPFVTRLQDIKEVAGNDLSPVGLQALAHTEAVGSATEHGREAAEALRVSTNQLQALIEALAPTRAARARD